MQSECSIVLWLRRLSANPEVGPLGVAILNIIQDVRESSMTQMDLEYLHLLVDGLSGEEKRMLAIRLLESARDCQGCDVCAALTARMSIDPALPSGSARIGPD